MFFIKPYLRFCSNCLFGISLLITNSSIGSVYSDYYFQIDNQIEGVAQFTLSVDVLKKIIPLNNKLENIEAYDETELFLIDYYSALKIGDLEYVENLQTEQYSPAARAETGKIRFTKKPDSLDEIRIISRVKWGEYDVVSVDLVGEKGVFRDTVFVDCNAKNCMRSFVLEANYSDYYAFNLISRNIIEFGSRQTEEVFESNFECVLIPSNTDGVQFDILGQILIKFKLSKFLDVKTIDFSESLVPPGDNQDLESVVENYYRRIILSNFDYSDISESKFMRYWYQISEDRDIHFDTDKRNYDFYKIYDLKLVTIDEDQETFVVDSKNSPKHYFNQISSWTEIHLLAFVNQGEHGVVIVQPFVGKKKTPIQIVPVISAGDRLYVNPRPESNLIWASLASTNCLNRLKTWVEI